MRNSLTKPFSGGSPEIAAAPTRKVAPVTGMRLSSPPSRSSLARAGGVQHRSGAEEQQALEHGMVDDVQQAAGEAQGRHRRVLVADPQDADAEPQRDDADVLHAVVGQQPFQVVLRQGVEHAEDARNDADGQQASSPTTPAAARAT